MTEILAVARAQFDMEDPWQVPTVCEPVSLRRAIDGRLPRLPTSVSAFFDDLHLTIIFSAADDFVRTTYAGDDEPLYEDDVVEVFITPAGLTRYYEFEVSPNGAIFDATVDSPHGSRQTMHVDRAWNCTGVIAAIRTVTNPVGAMVIDTLLRIPFAALDRRTPSGGETWRANFFRIDRHSTGDEFSAWQPTHRDPADFHVPAAFGALRF